MSEGFAAVESAARAVLPAVPQSVLRGEAACGLYGLGFLGRWAAARLRQQGIKLAAGYDGNPALHGTSVSGLLVHAPAALQAKAPEFIFIGVRHAVGPVSAMLADYGIAHVSYDAFHVASHIDAFRAIDARLDDDRSRAVLRAVLMGMLTGDARHCIAIAEPDQYFCLPRFRGAMGEIFVDAGAFVGDTVERFIWAHTGAFARIHAFEPGPRQFAALQTRARRLIAEWAIDPASLVLNNAGLGETGATLTAQSDSGQLTSLALGAATGAPADVLSLDSYLKGERVTFLKADVEGMEMALLKGARTTIQRDRPKIAVCVYHYPADIPEITQYLAELVPDYKFALRHHGPQLMETVLYCWTE